MTTPTSSHPEESTSPHTGQFEQCACDRGVEFYPSKIDFMNLGSIEWLLPHNTYSVEHLPHNPRFIRPYRLICE